MKMESRRGSITIVIVLALVIILVIAGGIWYYNVQKSSSPAQAISPAVSSSAPTINTILMNSGTVTGLVTINGTNLAGVTEVDFYTSGNSLVSGINPPSFNISSDGSSLTFALYGPTGANGVGYSVVRPGTYQVKVVSKEGISNAAPFVIPPPSTCVGAPCK